MFVASELERKFFNSLGNIKMSDIEPSDQLQKIIGSSAICSELLLNAQSSLEELNSELIVRGSILPLWHI